MAVLPMLMRAIYGEELAAFADPKLLDLYDRFGRAIYSSLM